MKLAIRATRFGSAITACALTLTQVQCAGAKEGEPFPISESPYTCGTTAVEGGVARWVNLPRIGMALQVIPNGGPNGGVCGAFISCPPNVPFNSFSYDTFACNNFVPNAIVYGYDTSNPNQLVFAQYFCNQPLSQVVQRLPNGAFRHTLIPIHEVERRSVDILHCVNIQFFVDPANGIGPQTYYVWNVQVNGQPVTRKLTENLGCFPETFQFD